MRDLMNEYLVAGRHVPGKQTGRVIIFIFLLTGACNLKDDKKVSPEAIQAINLKRGEVVLCGPSDKQFGSAVFDVSCSDSTKKEFNLAVALLHSFEYDEAEKVFAKIIDTDPGCAMAYWGVAMSNFHPIWAPSTPPELEKGTKAVKIARSLDRKSERESDYIEAIAQYYENWDKLDFHTRCVNYAKAMGQVYKKYPDDKEAAIFYALSIDAAANPADKSFADQKKAGSILNALYAVEPNHPGIVHYIIHTYDYPELAEMALPAARRYASIAPSSAHAQHMPSHIFTRLGLWDECIKSNLVSTSSAKCYAENASIKGHWDEELHGMDYLVYAYLQRAEDSLAKLQCEYLKTIHEVYPVSFKDAYAFAAIPARYLLENKLWGEAAHLETHPDNFPWNKFPWEKAIIHFARMLGSVHSGDLNAAKTELKKLGLIYDTLINEKDNYKARLVDIQMKAGEAWILFREGKKIEALKRMDSAANMEDATQKHPVTPGEIIPARELLGDMLLQMGEYGKALDAYKADLKLHQKRLNGLYGAGLAAERSGNAAEARSYYEQLSEQCIANSRRPELISARLYLKKVPG